MSLPAPGTVYLVGAGPGDPELLTLKAVRLLQAADVILHDDLVPAPVLAMAGPAAEVISVGKRCGLARITQEGIHVLMLEAARAGKSVVRLKSGDPLVFGRAGEEIGALRAANVPFEVVPGITAALAAGASLALPLTDRLHASKLIFVTGHHATGKDAHTPVWEGTLPADGTLVVYMPGRDLTRLAQDLGHAGLDLNTPCVAVSNAARDRQHHVACRLRELPHLVPGPAPLLVIVGAAVEELVL